MLQQTAEDGLAFAIRSLLERLHGGLDEDALSNIQKAAGILDPEVSDAAVTITIGKDAKQIESLRNLLGPPTAAVLEARIRKQRTNQIRQLALAALDYESATQVLPMHARYDAEGRPLLSWRVLVLPFLEEVKLYREFHLDEPWDSPHNRKLIERMPAVFSDPSAAVRRKAGDDGRTTFVVPVAPESAFPPRQALPKQKPLRIGDIPDGLSKTIMLVEVAPESAVIWTKPEDWEVDLDQAIKSLQRTDRKFFTVVLCDGSVQIMPNNTDAETIRAMITRAGGETVKW